jgi:hypothetical protein
VRLFLSTGFKNHLRKAFISSLGIYRGWNAPITFWGSFALTIFIFMLHKNDLRGSETVLGATG